MTTAHFAEFAQIHGDLAMATRYVRLDLLNGDIQAAANIIVSNGGTMSIDQSTHVTGDIVGSNVSIHAHKVKQELKEGGKLNALFLNLCRLRGIEVITLTDAHATAAGVMTNRRKGSRDNVVRWSPRLRAVWDAPLTLREETWTRPHMPAPIRPGDRPLIVGVNGVALKKGTFDSAWQTAITRAIADKVIAARSKLPAATSQLRCSTRTISVYPPSTHRESDLPLPTCFEQQPGRGLIVKIYADDSVQIGFTRNDGVFSAKFFYPTEGYTGRVVEQLIQLCDFMERNGQSEELLYGDLYGSAVLERVARS